MIFEGFLGRPQLEAPRSGDGKSLVLAGSNNSHSGLNPAIQDWKDITRTIWSWTRTGGPGLVTETWPSQPGGPRGAGGLYIHVCIVDHEFHIVHIVPGVQFIKYPVK